MSKNWLQKHWKGASKNESLARVAAKHTRKKGFAGSLLTENFEIPKNIFEVHLKTPAHNSAPSAYICCLVMELHKHKAKLAPLDCSGKAKTQNTFFAAVSRKFLQKPRWEKHLICVGDRVIVFAEGKHSKQIIHREKRHNSLERGDPFYAKRSHSLGANIHQLVVVASFTKPAISWHLINHYLTIAMIQDIPVVCLFSKKDLLHTLTKTQRSLASSRIQYLSKHLHIPTYRLDLTDKASTLKIAKNLFSDVPQKISIVSGLSGVGKSTLINSCGGLTECKVATHNTTHGKHTTSASKLIELKMGGMIMDTAGIKSFHLNARHSSQLDIGFPEFLPFSADCKFQPCYHLMEPKCAVKDAVERGDIPHWRYLSYTLMQKKVFKENHIKQESKKPYE